MKKLVRNAILLLVSALMFGFVSSCSNDDYIWDFNPIWVSFEVVDNNGVDQLAEGRALESQPFFVLYDGKEYAVSTDLPEWMGSRAYLPSLYGLLYLPAREGKKARLLFGELDGNIGEADLTLVMPDGSTHDLHISRNIKTKGPKATVKQTVKLDGKVIDELTDGDPAMTITIVI